MSKKSSRSSSVKVSLFLMFGIELMRSGISSSGSSSCIGLRACGIEGTNVDEDLGAKEAVRGNASTVEGPAIFEGPAMGTDGAVEPWVATMATGAVGAVPEVPPLQAIGTAVAAAAGGTMGFFCGVRTRPMAES